MRIGAIVRCDDRGLGYMTRSFVEGFQPAAVLVVKIRDGGTEAWDQHLDWYPEAAVVEWPSPAGKHALPEGPVREWLDGLDVVYSAETWYDASLPLWARDAAVHTVLHVMPELYPKPQAPVWTAWNPTDWRPTPWSPSDVVPVPVPELRREAEPDGGPLRVLHVAGRRALADRNGTDLFVDALRLVRRPLRVRIEIQLGELRLPKLPAHVEVEVVRGRPDRWEMYRDADVLVLPRRYGGLCLPAMEAMASGLAVVMPGVAPNTDWPIQPLPTVPAKPILTPSGRINTRVAPPPGIARLLDTMAAGGAGAAAMVVGLQLRSRTWASRNTWAALRPLYQRRFAEATCYPPVYWRT